MYLAQMVLVFLVALWVYFYFRAFQWVFTNCLSQTPAINFRTPAISQKSQKRYLFRHECLVLIVCQTIKECRSDLKNSVLESIPLASHYSQKNNQNHSSSVYIPEFSVHCTRKIIKSISTTAPSIHQLRQLQEKFQCIPPPSPHSFSCNIETNILASN